VSVVSEQEDNMSNSDFLLSVQGVNKRFGGLQALSDVGLQIKPGEIYGLIGPNGAGKTTFFNVITGLYTPDSGEFVLGGKPYQPTAVHEVAKAGIARTFQNIRLFGDMTALENVMVGRHVRTKAGLFGAIFRRLRCVRKKRPSKTWPTICSTTWASASTPTSRRATCPTATSAVWRSPARWPPSQSCWRWTNRPPA
jgi:ABC-type uncharacterized transport system ATPase subunit